VTKKVNTVSHHHSALFDEVMRMKVLTMEEIQGLSNDLLDPFCSSCLTAVGYDIRVGEKIFFLSSGKEMKLKRGEFVQIPPRERFAVESLEKVKMKDNMFALVSTRIKLLWEGLTGLGTRIDPMFQDKLLLIFSNESDIPLRLEYEQPICNVLFFKYENPPAGLETKIRPSLMPPRRPEKIDEPVEIDKIQQKYGLAVASVLQYARPRIRDLEKRTRGLEKFRTRITEIAIAAISTLIVGLIIWLITRQPPPV
jgi:deoxycytidine triphosphate deaminase